MFQNKYLDQYYTNPKVASYCMDFLNKNFNLNNFFLLEPSAGKGAFSDLFHNNSLALDIDPKKDYIFQSNFLNFDKSFLNNKKVFTIGNPPFGINSSLAISFFNKAAEFSDYIAFIVPKSFNNFSTKSQLSYDFNLKFEVEIPENSFIFNEKEYSVPCVFQVFEKIK